MNMTNSTNTTQGLTEEQKYFFDTFGYLVLKNVLTEEQVNELRTTLKTPTEQFEPIEQDEGPLHWGELWRTLLDLPRITPILEDIIGNHEKRVYWQKLGRPYVPTYRFDHLNVHTHIKKGFKGGLLHGGWGGVLGYSSYHDGRLYNGLVSVSFELYDTYANDGGFACIPGSHKANLNLPEHWRDLSKEHPPFLKRVAASAGDVILFTEAITHGTLPWTVEDKRTTLFYKYSPHGLSWSGDYFNPDDFRKYSDMNERKLALLEAPNARYPGRPTAPKPINGA